MSDDNRSRATDVAPHENLPKDPAEWTTGDEPMSGPERSYLTTLCHGADETFDPNLTKVQAPKLIDALQHRAGRGATLRDATERKSS
jgi:Protein of unknown function (DUF3072)